MHRHHPTSRSRLKRFLEDVLSEEQHAELSERLPLSDDAQYVNPSYGPRHLWGELRRVHGSSMAGPDLAQKYDPKQTGVLWLHVSRQKDVRLAFLAFCRMLPMLFPTMRARLVVSNREAILEIASCDRRISRDGSDFAVGAVLNGVRLLVPGFQPLRLTIPTPAASSTEYAKKFGCPVETHGTTIELVFEPSVLDAPLASHQPADHSGEALAALERAAALNPLAPLEEHYRDAIVSGANLELASMAASMDITEAQLTRALHSRMTTHREILERARLELALEWLTEPDLTIDEMANRLQMAHRSAFIRAFKRCTGISPARYRTRYLSVQHAKQLERGSASTGLSDASNL